MATATKPDEDDAYLHQILEDLRAIANGGGRIKWDGLYEENWIAPWERLPGGYPRCDRCHWKARMPMGYNDIPIRDFQKLWSPSSAAKSDCGCGSQPADGCGKSDDGDDGDKAEEDEEGDDDEDDEDEDEDEDEDDGDGDLTDQEDDNKRDYNIWRWPHLAGISMEVFKRPEGYAYISFFQLPPTLPGLMKLRQPSPVENNTDRELKERFFTVLKEARWRPAYDPGTFQATCQQWPTGYGVYSSRFYPSFSKQNSYISIAFRPTARLHMHDNPIFA
ncbi:hypothetical protein FJTKL_12088 [Diaporthe vaccinii]|uniref:Uncharacterized protein n=1 Tax=Diaporthe vaccinii TaxID=105482 RepID=A0ABR4EF93_9PEZI